MKRIFTFVFAYLFAITPLFAQTDDAPAQATKAALCVFYPDNYVGMPDLAIEHLTTKMDAATALNGMGGNDAMSQFYLTCVPLEIEKYMVPGAPPKHFSKLELNFYVVDSFSKKIFHSYTMPVTGVGNSDAKAYIDSFKRFSSRSEHFSKFLNEANTKIIDYYEAQCDNIITRAWTMANSYNYDEALYILSIFPECCPSYSKVLAAANEIYQKYIDDMAARNLAKAKSIWYAGQDARAASEAGEYLSEILPDSKYYSEAVALSNEMKTRVSSDIDYYRAIEKRNNEQQYDIDKKQIDAWKSVGVAYGNHQQPVTYNTAWLWR